MVIAPGTLILGRYEVLEALPSQGELRRHLARDGARGALVEVVTPTGTARLRPGARERWRRAWDRVEREGPLVPVLAMGEHDGRPVAVRPRLYLSPRDLRLDAEELGRALGDLLPRVGAAAGALQGRLGPEDLAFDAEGGLVLCPSGLVPEDSLARPDRFRPTRPGGLEADALYGLGVWAFEALTGAWPAQGRTANQLARAQARPRRPADLGVAVPGELDAALAGLLSLEAVERLRVSLPGEGVLQLDPERLGLPAETERIALDRAGSAEPTRPLRPPAIQRDEDDPRPPGGHLDLALPAWVVVADPGAASRAARRRLAALAGLDEAALERAAAAGDRVAVGGGSTEGEARAASLALAPAGLPLAVEPEGARWLPPLAVALASLVLAGGLATLGVLGVFTVVIPIFTTALALLVAGVGLAIAGVLAGRESGRVAQLRRHWGPLKAALRPPSAEEQRLQEVRRAVLDSDLSLPEQRDLLDVVDELAARWREGELEADALGRGLRELEAATRRAAIDGELDGAEAGPVAPPGAELLSEETVETEEVDGPPRARRDPEGPDRT